jgi:hypothetical protein
VEQGKKMNKFSNNLNSKPLAIDLLNTSLDLSTLLKNNVSWEGKDKEELNFKIL